jgi:transcription-repair coupling factor (superfamily II helicase)
MTKLFSPTLPDQAGLRHWWDGLHGSAVALSLCHAAYAHPGLSVILTPDSLSAQKLENELHFFLGNSLPLRHFPDWETLPYDVFSPHQDIVSERLTTLFQLPDIRQGVLILPVTTLMQRLPPTGYVQRNTLLLRRGDKFARESFRARLEAAGYRAVSQVMEHGEFAVRGSLLDLFPAGSRYPYRIDLFDDEVDTLRMFDPESQRTKQEVEEIRLLPAREFPLTADAIAIFRRQWAQHFHDGTRNSPIYRDVSQGMAPGGIEYYLPLFFEENATLFDYLPQATLCFSLPGVREVALEFEQETRARYEMLRHDIDRPLLEPTQLFLSAEELNRALKNYPQVFLNHAKADTTDARKGLFHFATQAPPLLPVDARLAQPTARLHEFLDGYHGRVLLAAETAGRREALMDLFKGSGKQLLPLDTWQAFYTSDAALAVAIAPLEQGLLLDQLCVITETQLFGERVAQRRRRKSAAAEEKDNDAVVRSLAELTPGTPVVHEDYGVGRFLGLASLDTGGMANEYLQLEYANGDKLYVPVTSLHLISRFTGIDPDHAPLHRLGSGQWEKARRKAIERVRDVAAELLAIHARRAARKGHVFHHDADAYRAFVQGFAFEETPDQQAAIDAVMADMHSPRAMDRLVCGDVGFGKTEVAMRAAFVAVQGGKQVAVLVPTTLLAQQHYQNFCDRFADFPVNIVQLSRFKTAKEQKVALADLLEGRADIVIGTHKLIQDSIKFKDLGLVIIDEEHRFGVRQKDRFKQLRAEVDILTLTATPIPRSLNMALSDLRDLSIIASPPAKRLAVKTFVSEWQDEVLKEAIVRELKRGGQVYFLHNDIDSIEKTARELAQLVPDARVDIGHGQMAERDLERVMSDFYHRRFNVLVCTTIIETGIDVPSANTIIINRADRFGLAQLYQLRGRVGRSHHRAYAYLITPPRRALTDDARKRLDALSAIEELGMGFTLATHDLEIRGAGELLGDEQSGHMQQIGFSLYSELLGRAVAALKEGRTIELDRPLDHGTEVDLRVPALIPEDYMPDVHNRLIFYKRIASAKNQEVLRELQVELIDRFGLLPEPAKALLELAEIKLRATPLGIKKIELGENGGKIAFHPEPPLDPMKLIGLVQKYPQKYRPDKDQNLRIHKKMPELKDRLAELNEILRAIS